MRLEGRRGGRIDVVELARVLDILYLREVVSFRHLSHSTLGRRKKGFHLVMQNLPDECSFLFYFYFYISMSHLLQIASLVSYLKIHGRRNNSSEPWRSAWATLEEFERHVTEYIYEIPILGLGPSVCIRPFQPQQ